MKHSKATRASFTCAAIAAVAMALTSCAGSSSGTQSAPTESGPPTEMNVLSFSGHLNDVNQIAAKGFERQYNVKLNWQAGDPAGNVAKVLAGKGHQTYDIAFVDSQSQYVASLKGAWEKLDPKIVTNMADTAANGITPNKDGIGYGTYPTGMYYNADKFKEKGWSAPTSFQDILKPQYCGIAGLAYIDDVYGVYAMLSLGSTVGKEAPLNQLFDNGMAKLAAKKKCFPNFESSSGGHDQKILTDQYYIGITGQARILPMQNSGKNIKFVVPEEGAFYVTSTVNIAVNTPHKKLAQEFVNWMASPTAEKIQMEQSFYVPTNTTVVIPANLAARGLVGGDKLAKLVRPFDLKTVNTELPGWKLKWDAVFAS